MECSDDAIVGKSLEGIINSWNRGAERVFGYTAAEMVGQSIYKLIPAEKTHEEREILRKIRHGEPVAHFQTTRIHKDGRFIDVSLSVSPIRDTTGKIIGASKIARDITRQKQIERALARPKHLCANAPRTSRNGCSNARMPWKKQCNRWMAFATASRTIYGRPCARWAGSVENSARSMARCSTKRPALSRTHSHLGRQDGPFDSGFIAVWTPQHGRIAGRHGQARRDVPRALDTIAGRDSKRQAVVQFMKPVLSATANPVMLEQVLVNLFTNAIKFVPPGVAPEVNVHTDTSQGKVRIKIRDNGIGIKQQHIEKLFRPFSRLVGGDEFPGTGIGLAIVRKGVERMGGRVGVESKLGVGSTFWIELPEGVPAETEPANDAVENNENTPAKARLMPI